MRLVRNTRLGRNRGAMVFVVSGRFRDGGRIGYDWGTGDGTETALIAPPFSTMSGGRDPPAAVRCDIPSDEPAMTSVEMPANSSIMTSPHHSTLRQPFRFRRPRHRHPVRRGYPGLDRGRPEATERRGTTTVECTSKLVVASMR